MTHRILAWLSAFVGLCSPVAIGADAAVQLVFRQADGATETRAVTLVADGVVQHLRVSKQAIPAGTRHVEVHHPMATAKAGEDGFYVLSNGMYGTFRERPNAAYRNPHVVMPVFGVSTPRGAMTVIVTGLRYEAFQMVDLKGGIYRVESFPEKPRYSESLVATNTVFMESHSPVADQVFKTTFSDGTSIVSNYGDADWEYRGRTIKSMGYLVVKE